MKFYPLPLEGAYCLEPEEIHDERGYFARTYCKEEFLKFGLNPHLEQCSLSFNRCKYTVRGMHYQISPFKEAKLVSCVQGAIFDVIIDMRKDSKTFLEWFGVELTAENNKQLYIPEGFAHGFQTLADNSKVFYQISEKFHPSSARGVRWDDPRFAIAWPYKENITISQKDISYSDFIYEKDPCNRC